MATTRQQIHRAGGFVSLANYLADDYELGRRIARSGTRLNLCPVVVECRSSPLNWREVWTHQLRWARTMRVSRPGGYLASGITLPFPAVLLALLVAPSLSTGLAAVGLLYAVRLTVGTVFSRLLVKDSLLPRWLWLLPLRDLLAFSTWALSFLGNRVDWRGSRFKLSPGGKIEEISP